MFYCLLSNKIYNKVNQKYKGIAMKEDDLKTNFSGHTSSLQLIYENASLDEKHQLNEHIKHLLNRHKEADTRFVEKRLHLNEVDEKGILIFFTGKMGAGKSTYSKRLANESGAVLLSEDDWLSAIYPEEIKNFDDYIKYSSRLKPLLKEHVKRILHSGSSVIMDFPGNTKKQRAWFKEIFLEDQIPHKLIYLKAEDQLCLKRLEQRRQDIPQRAQFDSEEVFHQVTSYFQAPDDDEGFNIEVVCQ